MHQTLEIFVIQIPEGPDLAFQADCATQAAAIAGTPWLRDAIENLPTTTGRANAVRNSPSVRAATSVEARIYRQLREEFDEPASSFLVADLSGFGERYADGSAETLP